MVKKNGFTLLELLISLFIISIITGIGFAYFSSNKANLKKDTRILYNYLQFMRLKAIQIKSRTYIQFNISNKNYSLYYDNGTIIKTVNLSQNVQFSSVSFGATNPPKAYFYPDGSCSPSGSIVLKDNNNNTYQITINLAGNISVQ